MTLQFEVRNQELVFIQPLVVSDTINYLEAKFDFLTDDWSQVTSKWAHFKKGTTVYDVELSNNVAANLPLTDGEWEIYLHGSKTQLNTVILRITTEICTLNVTKTGVLSGQPFAPTPTSAIEHLEARLDSLEESTVSASTLPVGSSATATKSVVGDHFNIAFGIPKGDTGASGVEISSTQPTDPVVNVWINPTGLPENGLLPVGGTSGQILKKHSNSDFDTEWANAPTEHHLYVHDIVIVQTSIIRMHIRLLTDFDTAFESISVLAYYLHTHYDNKRMMATGWYIKNTTNYIPYALEIDSEYLRVYVRNSGADYSYGFYPSESPTAISVGDSVTQIF